MSMDVISLARDYLMERYRPHCIILYGSHARGDAGPSSDIDIVCFCDGVEAQQDARPFHGTFLDGWIYPATALGSTDPEWLRFAGGKLLLDLTGEGKGLLERLDALLKAGRSPMSPQERASTLVWVEKMVARAGCDELDGHYRRTWLQYELLSLYFELRGLWFLGHKQGFVYLKAQDPETHGCFEASYRHPLDHSRLRQLVKAVVGSGDGGT